MDYFISKGCAIHQFWDGFYSVRKDKRIICTLIEEDLRIIKNSSILSQDQHKWIVFLKDPDFLSTIDEWIAAPYIPYVDD